MKKFWIIKKSPDDENLARNGDCRAYTTREEAEDRCKEYVNKNQCRMVVFEAVTCFAPIVNVQELVNVQEIKIQ